MTPTVAAATAAIGSILLFAGFLLAWYAEVAGSKKGPALLLQTLGAFLLMVALVPGLPDF